MSMHKPAGNPERQSDRVIKTLEEALQEMEAVLAKARVVVDEYFRTHPPNDSQEHQTHA